MTAREPWEDILDELMGLLPPGIAWPSDPDSWLGAVLEARAKLSADLRAAMRTFLERELSPATAVWCLPDYERILGPDPCRPGGFPETLAERQAEADLRWREIGGASIPYFRALLEPLDPTVSIEEFAPFQCGVSEAGDTRSPDQALWYAPAGAVLTTADGTPLATADGTLLASGPLIRLPPRWQVGPPEIAYAWRVSLSTPAITWFEAGAGVCGRDPLGDVVRNAVAECRIRRRKPAHTLVVFDYSAPAWLAPEPLRGAA